MKKRNVIISFSCLKTSLWILYIEFFINSLLAITFYKVMKRLTQINMIVSKHVGKIFFNSTFWKRCYVFYFNHDINGFFGIPI
jgi:hypothetical protein